MIYAVHNGCMHDDERIDYVEAPLDFGKYFEKIFLPWATEHRDRFDAGLPYIVFEAVLVKWGAGWKPMRPAVWLRIVVVSKPLEDAPPYVEGAVGG